MNPPTSTSASHMPPRAALLALFAGAFSIGFAPILVKLSPADPTATAFWRFALAIPFFVALVLWDRRRRPWAPHAPVRTRPRDFLLYCVPGVLFAGDLAFWHWSIEYTTVANATLLTNTAPILVTAVAVAFYGERITAGFVWGLALALMGAAILMRNSLQISPDNLWGDVLGLITAVWYAAYQLSVKRLRYRVPTITLMTWSCASGAVVLFVVCFVIGEPLFWTDIADWRGWAVLFGLAFVGQTLGQGLIAYAFAHLPASFSSLSLLLQPVVAAVAAWVILGQALTAWHLVGGVVVLWGILLARRGSLQAILLTAQALRRAEEEREAAKAREGAAP